MDKQTEQGSALILTMVITIILLFLGSSLGLLSMVESRMALREEQSMQAYYLARSGADAVAQAIIDDPAWLNEVGGIINRGSETKSLGPGEFTVQVLKVGEDVWVESTGVVGKTVRTVRLSLQSNEIVLPPIDFAIYAGHTGDASNPSISLTGGARVSGSVVTNATVKDSIRLDNGATIEGNLWVGKDTEQGEIDRLTADPLINGSVAPKQTYFPLPSFPEITLGPDNQGADKDLEENTHDVYYESITSAETLKIKVPDGGVREVYIEKLKTGWGGLEIIGDGQLILYADEITFSGGNINYDSNSLNPEALTIYYTGSRLDLANNVHFAGNLVVQDAAIHLGSGKFNGNIFSAGSSGITIDNGNGVENGIVYAPNAKVDLQGGVNTGPIIAAQFSAGNGAQIKFDGNVSTDSFPEGIFASAAGGGGNSSSVWGRGKWSAGW